MPSPNSIWVMLPVAVGGVSAAQAMVGMMVVRRLESEVRWRFTMELGLRIQCKDKLSPSETSNDKRQNWAANLAVRVAGTFEAGKKRLPQGLRCLYAVLPDGFFHPTYVSFKDMSCFAGAIGHGQVLFGLSRDSFQAASHLFHRTGLL